MKNRLDFELVRRHMVTTRSQATSYIKLAKVMVNGRTITKAGYLVDELSQIKLTQSIQYVSRAALKLESVAQILKLKFQDAIVLDVGSSTGGFTDYALRHGAAKVVAVDVGSKQLHTSLLDNPRVELHEQTDIRSFKAAPIFDFILIDVSFISLRQILGSVTELANNQTLLLAMVKPQFEIGDIAKHKGVIKNNSIRRTILKDFEVWLKQAFVIINKADSSVAGAKGNLERFYLLKKLKP